MKPARFLAFAASLLVAGCAGSTAEGCKTVDWYQQGYADGTRTWYSLLDQHAARCAPFGVQPDAAQYEKGRETGAWDRAHRAL